MSAETIDHRQRDVSFPQKLWEDYQRVRRLTQRICQSLQPEDCVIQSMPDASPTRWHLAHTTWFFETFVLKSQSWYRRFNDDFEYLFNSYYNTVGRQFPRPQRGLLSRPTVAEVWQYRAHVDAAMARLLGQADEIDSELGSTIRIGLNHEQQHQELMLTDIKHVFSCNPLMPALTQGKSTTGDTGDGEAKPQWSGFGEGIYQIGFDGDGFAFDNETPRHRVFLDSFRLRTSLVTNEEFLRFMADGGYEPPGTLARRRLDDGSTKRLERACVLAAT